MLRKRRWLAICGARSVAVARFVGEHNLCDALNFIHPVLPVDISRQSGTSKDLFILICPTSESGQTKAV